MGELCLVDELSESLGFDTLGGKPKTGAEVLKESTQTTATTKLVLKRFPDVVSRNGRW